MIRSLIPKFLVREFVDKYLQENFSRLNDHFQNNTNLVGFKHFELTFNKAETRLKIPHNLGFKPKDYIVCSLTGLGSISIDYEGGDDVNMIITSTNSCVVRLYIGTHIEGTI